MGIFHNSQSMWIKKDYLLDCLERKNSILISLQRYNICALQHYFDKSDGVFANRHLRDEKTNISKRLASRMYKGLGLGLISG